LTESVIIA